MLKNSQSRIAKRRKGALQRRIVDVKKWSNPTSITSNGMTKEDVGKEIKRKLDLATAEVAILQGKGVRV